MGKQGKIKVRREKWRERRERLKNDVDRSKMSRGFARRKRPWKRMAVSLREDEEGNLSRRHRNVVLVEDDLMYRGQEQRLIKKAEASGK